MFAFRSAGFIQMFGFCLASFITFAHIFVLFLSDLFALTFSAPKLWQTLCFFLYTSVAWPLKKNRLKDCAEFQLFCSRIHNNSTCTNTLHIHMHFNLFRFWWCRWCLFSDGFYSFLLHTPPHKHTHIRWISITLTCTNTDTIPHMRSERNNKQSGFYFVRLHAIDQWLPIQKREKGTDRN